MLVRGLSRQLYWLDGVHTCDQALDALATSGEPLPSAVLLIQNGKIIRDVNAPLLTTATLEVLPAGDD